MDQRAARAVTAQLLSAWSDTRQNQRPSGTTFEASLDAIELALPPPAGLAVGHSVDCEGRAHIGVRVSATGSRLRAARKLVADLTRSGTPVDFRIIPRLSLPNAGIAAALDAGGSQASQFGGHFRPLYPGSSVSHEEGPAGTLGAFVHMVQENRLGVLSCTHVLALWGDAKVGDNVCQPAQQDQVERTAEFRIGTLSAKFATLVANQPNNLDAAVAYLDPATFAFGNRVPNVDLSGPNKIPLDRQDKPFGQVLIAATIPRGTKVAKIGRSSGYTEGMVTYSVLNNVAPDIQRKGKWQTYPFSDVIEIESLSASEPFARGGDSGALVFTIPDLRPIGLHFMSVPLEGQPSLNYLMPLDRICAMLQVKLLGPNG